MRLHETPVQDPRLGVQQIQAQVQNLCLEIQNLKQEQTPCSKVQEEVWCIKCRSQGHVKDHCPVSVNFLVTGELTPLRLEAQVGSSVIALPWCAICQVGGNHMTYNWHILQKFTQTPQQLFCNFCRLVG